MLISLKPIRRVDLHAMVTKATLLEGGFNQVNIAQASGLCRHFLDLLAQEWRTNPKGVAKMLEGRS